MKSGSIFYCDDDSDDLIVFADAIRDFAPQIKCITMREPEKALAYLLQTSDIPDMIFLDINMPKMTGVELLSALRSVERFKVVPVIMYTTSKNKKEIELCMALGAMEVVQKLYSYETIEANLCKVINRYWPEFSMVHKA